MKTKTKLILLTALLVLSLSVSFASAAVPLIEIEVGTGFSFYTGGPVVDFDDSLFCDSYGFILLNATYADYVYFTNAYMDTGPKLSLLQVYSSVNLTFSTVKSTEISYNITGAGEQTFNLTMPTNVTLDGIETLENDGWTYNDTTNLLTITDATSTVIISFTAAPTNPLSFIDELILSDGIFSYIILIVIIILISVSIFKWKLLAVPMFVIAVLLAILYLVNGLGWHSLIMFLTAIFILIYVAKEIS